MTDKTVPTFNTKLEKDIGGAMNKHQYPSRGSARPNRERSFVMQQAGVGRMENDIREKRGSNLSKEKSFIRGSKSTDQMRDNRRESQMYEMSEKSDSPPTPNNNNNNKVSATWRGKPSRELYRPPISSVAEYPSISSPLNPAAKEFQPPGHQHRNTFATGQEELTITVRGSGGHTVRKSKSATTTPSLSYPDLSELGNFPPDIQETVNRALEDPNRLSGRSVMDLVRHIFGRVVEGRRYAEPAARLCMSIIERESRETFLESFLNSCQEWYHDRERLLRQTTTRWTAFISFLSQMYGMLKRKQLHLMTKYEGVPPKLVLLSLIAECCTDTLTSPTQDSVTETECLFIILTSVGRDLEQETPGRMTSLVSCLRNCFLTCPATTQVRKTLLQLVELQAAGWQLPAQAVMYYYPGANI